MQVLLVRHAPAEERDGFHYPDDDQRPLSRKGRRAFHVSVAGLARIIKVPTEIHASPTLRTLQTAHILCVKATGNTAQVRIAPQLHHDFSVKRAYRWLRTLPAGGNRVLVGHEPWLGRFVAHCLGASPTNAFPFTKGGACLLRFEPGAKDGCELQWMITAKQLALLAR